MRTLYHWPLDPDSRQARLALAEKKLKFKLVQVTPWDPDDVFLRLCTEGIPPCLTEDSATDKTVISSARAICEFIADDTGTRYPLMPNTAIERAEARRMANWFDVKFSGDVNAYILTEKLEKSLSGSAAPDPATLRIGHVILWFIRHHCLCQFSTLQMWNWLAVGQPVYETRPFLLNHCALKDSSHAHILGSISHFMDL